ncbi:MAG: hypothetical protein OXU67_13170 [Chloroflexota bacterium]|nr:hypothetical protein [Chloroflexota bacterium]
MAEWTGASEPPRGAGWRLWLLWVLASVVGGGVGGVVLGPVFSVVEPAFGLLVGGVAVGAIGGAALGVLQWLVLRGRLVRAGWWIVASTVGWAVGGAAFGLVGGAVTGVLQWLVLRRRLARAGWWIAASTVGWAIGPVIVLFGGVIGELDAALIVLLVAVLWGIGGLVGGAITGVVLVWLLRQRLVDADGG